MYDSEEAATKQTITGWVSANGRFWGTDEHMARWDGCTHIKCTQCGEPHSKNYTICDVCLTKKRIDSYHQLPYRDWDRKSCVYDGFTDKFFFGGEDEIREYYKELDITSIRLQYTEPNYLSKIDTDSWSDILPEDTYDLPNDVMKAIEALNEVLDKQGAISYSPVNIRTSL